MRVLNEKRYNELNIEELKISENMLAMQHALQVKYTDKCRKHVRKQENINCNG